MTFSKRVRFSAALVPLLFAGVFLVSGAPAKQKASKPKADAKTASKVPASPIDINTASEKDLDALPGIGPATAKKIMAGRPYRSPAELSRAGISPSALKKITPLVMVGGSPYAPSASNHPSQPVVNRNSPSAYFPNLGSTARHQAIPAAGAGAGMVWVNPATKVFHHQGDRWYGKTKSGQYMREPDAIRAGYRDSKTDAAAKK